MLTPGSAVQWDGGYCYPRRPRAWCGASWCSSSPGPCQPGHHQALLDELLLDHSSHDHSGKPATSHNESPICLCDISVVRKVIMRIAMSKRLIYLLKLFKLKAFYYISHSFVFFFSYYPKVILNCFRPRGKKNLFSLFCYVWSEIFLFLPMRFSFWSHIISWNNDLRYRPWLCRKYSFKHFCCKKRLSRYVSTQS